MIAERPSVHGGGFGFLRRPRHVGIAAQDAVVPDLESTVGPDADRASAMHLAQHVVVHDVLTRDGARIEASHEIAEHVVPSATALRAHPAANDGELVVEVASRAGTVAEHARVGHVLVDADAVEPLARTCAADAVRGTTLVLVVVAAPALDDGTR